MTSEDAIKVLEAVRTAWPYQPMSDRERHAWLRALSDPMTHVGTDEARAALNRYVATGGSQAAANRGQRPGVAEFVGSITGARTRDLPAVFDTRSQEPWPEVDPQRVSEHIAAIKQASGINRRSV